MYLLLDGTPCITSSLIDIHVAAGYGGTPFILGSYPFSADIAPYFFIVFSAIWSISAVVIPGFIASSIALCVNAVTLPASLINSISLFDFIVTIFSPFTQFIFFFFLGDFKSSIYLFF